MGVLKALFGLGEAMVAFVVIVAMAGVAVLVTGLKLGLISGQFFLLVGAVSVLLMSTWLHYRGHTGIAKVFVFGATMTIAGVVITNYLPGTSKAAQSYAAYQDQKNLERVQRQMVQVIAPFACDASNADSLSFFAINGADGTPIGLLYYDYDRQGRIVCFTNPGVNPKTGQEVRVITPAVAAVIAAQKPPAPPPTPAPVLNVADDELTWSSPAPPLRP